MNREVLVRLAIDRALGAMPPDTRQLFSEYLRMDPRSEEMVRSMEGTLSLAKHVMKDKSLFSMPAFPVAGLLQVERWRWRMRTLVGAGGMAACLMIGLGLGRLFAPAAVKSGEPSPVVVVRADPRSAGPAEEAGKGLWSIQRIREQGARETPRRSRSVLWYSPVAPPRLGDPT